jgi:hypothetical protein
MLPARFNRRADKMVCTTAATTGKRPSFFNHPLRKTRLGTPPQLPPPPPALPTIPPPPPPPTFPLSPLLLLSLSPRAALSVQLWVVCRHAVVVRAGGGFVRGIQTKQQFFWHICRFLLPAFQGMAEARSQKRLSVLASQVCAAVPPKSTNFSEVVICAATRTPICKVKLKRLLFLFIISLKRNIVYFRRSAVLSKMLLRRIFSCPYACTLKSFCCLS